MATTLLTVPCSHTNTTVWESFAARGRGDRAIPVHGLKVSRTEQIVLGVALVVFLA